MDVLPELVTPAQAEKRKQRRENRRRCQGEHDVWVQAGAQEVPMERVIWWVLNSLTVLAPKGSPCPGARALWGWARMNKAEFFRLYLPKLISGAGKKAVQEEGADASLEMLKKAMGGKDA